MGFNSVSPDAAAQGASEETCSTDYIWVCVVRNNRKIVSDYFERFGF